MSKWTVAIWDSKHGWIDIFPKQDVENKKAAEMVAESRNAVARLFDVPGRFTAMERRLCDTDQNKIGLG